MWFWNGLHWQFLSLASPLWTEIARAEVKRMTLPGEPKPTIHEAPIAVSEYVARIREKCD